MNQHLSATTPTLTDAWTALIDPLMTLEPYVIAAASAALTIYAIAELLCPHPDTSIDTADRQLRSDIDFGVGAVLAVSLVLLVAPYLLTAGLDPEAIAVPISGSQIASRSTSIRNEWSHNGTHEPHRHCHPQGGHRRTRCHSVGRYRPALRRSVPLHNPRVPAGAADPGRRRHACGDLVLRRPNRIDHRLGDGRGDRRCRGRSRLSHLRLDQAHRGPNRFDHRPIRPVTRA